MSPLAYTAEGSPPSQAAAPGWEYFSAMKFSGVEERLQPQIRAKLRRLRERHDDLQAAIVELSDRWNRVYVEYGQASGLLKSLASNAPNMDPAVAYPSQH